MDKDTAHIISSARRSKSEALAVPSLVSRKQELAKLEHYLELAKGGNGTTVFVSGEAGVGKTRLVNEFLKSARKQEITVLTGWCLSNVAVPYFPFFEAFNIYFSGDETGKILNVTKWLKGPIRIDPTEKAQFLTPQAWKDKTFMAVTNTLSSISAKKPVIIFIDDIHWADSASLALIHYIARVIKSERILLVATFRSEELTVDAEGRPHSLVKTLSLMRREELYTEINVSSLNQESVEELAKGMLQGKLQQRLVQKLTKESQGNPLFIVESLRLLHERDELIQENEYWQLTNDQLEIPNKIKDIILQRLGCLVHNQRKMIEVASVIGENFDPKLLALVLNSDFDEVVATLDLISKTTFLLDYEVELYWFDHSRTRDTIYAEISPILKKIYHTKIAETLIEMSKSQSLPFSELAYHYGRAGETEKSVKFALAAGQDALTKWSNSEAIKQFSYVLNKTRDDPKFIEEKTIALEGLGDALYANSLVKEATEVFLDLADIAVDDIVRLRAYRKAMEAVFQYGDMAYLAELVKKTEPISAADRLEHARVLMQKARSFQMRAMYSGSFDPLRRALQVFEEEYSLWDVAWVLIGGGPQHALFAKTDSERRKGLAESLLAIKLFEDLGDLRWQMEAYYVAGLTFSYCLLEDEALELLSKVLEIDEKNKFGDYLRQIYSLATSARSFLGIGNTEQSLAYSKKALKLLEKTDSGVAHGMIYSNLTIEYALLENFAKSEEYFDKFMKLQPEIHTNVLTQFAIPKAVFLAVKNQWKESNELFEERLNFFNQDGMPTALGFRLRLKLLYAWSLRRQGCFKKAKTLLEEREQISRVTEKKFAHASLQAHLLVRRKAEVGEEVEMRIDIVNVGKRSSQILRIEDLLSSEAYKVTSLPEQFDFSKNNLNLNKKEIGAFQVETIRLKVQATKPGVFCINPLLVYINDLDKTKKCKVNQITLTVHKAQPQFEVLPGRITTGYMELDRVLMGGIPEKTAVVLTSPPSDERAHLIKSFLEAGPENDEVVFHITTEADYIDNFLENPNFHLFLCNPKPKVEIPDRVNVTKLRSKTDINNLNMALARESRGLQQEGSPRRLCIEIVSDVLLRLGPEVTRRWLSELITDLCSKGFTMLAVMDPSMHPADQANAVINSFDGEISITQTEDATGCRKFLRVKRLNNQDYLTNSACLKT